LGHDDAGEYAEVTGAHAEAAERGSCTPYEKEYIRKDGSRVPILCGYALLEGSEDEYVGFVFDLTRQRAAERDCGAGAALPGAGGEPAAAGVYLRSDRVADLSESAISGLLWDRA